MPPTVSESVGPEFQEDLIIQARDLSLRIIELARRRIKPGTTEEQGKQIIKELMISEKSEKAWHPAQVRFGVNTLCSFGKPGEPNVALKENDVYFLDIGPVFGIHEGDVGRTFALGNDPEMIKISQDVEMIWHNVRERWRKTQETGVELYNYATQFAAEHGWQLSLQGASGHRIADFPHAARQRGSVRGLDYKPAPNKWILEIQIRHPSRPFGAFYEDLLN